MLLAIVCGGSQPLLSWNENFRLADTSVMVVELALPPVDEMREPSTSCCSAQNRLSRLKA